MVKRAWTAGFLLLLLPSAAAAQPALRTLEVPSSSAWQHAETSLILPSRSAGLTRGSVQDTGAGELDIVAQYANAGRSSFATIYLFRSQIESAPLWFDRSRTVLERLSPGRATGPGPRPVMAFALTGSKILSGLSVAYPGSTNGLSTALAVVPLNGWMVKVRISSTDPGVAALDHKLSEFISSIRWPATLLPAPAAVPVEPCSSPLVFKKAKMMKPDMEQSLIGSFLAMAGATKSSRPQSGSPIVYCRDSDAGVAYGVYRPVSSTTGYMIAINDAGRAVSVGEALTLDKSKQLYSVTLLDLGRSSVFPSYNRLPGPRQVMETLPRTRPMSSTEVGTTTINIDASSVQ